MLFKFFDVNDYNYITVDDVMKAFGKIGLNIKKEVIKEIFETYDIMNEGKMGFELFKGLMMADLSL